ncbi:unnamed protein product, partial [Ilex paraguariensis]
MKAIWSDIENGLTSGDDSTSQDDEENVMAFIRQLSYSPRETSIREVEASPTTEVDDLEEKIPTWVEDEDCYEDIQDVCEQLYVQFLKQQEK